MFDWRAPGIVERQLGAPVLCAGVFAAAVGAVIARKVYLYTMLAKRVALSHGPAVLRDNGNNGPGKIHSPPKKESHDGH